MGRRLTGDDLLGQVDGVIHGNGEPDARVVAGVRGDQRVDADKLALVIHQRAAGIAGVDGRIGLNHVRVDGDLAGTAGLHRFLGTHNLGAARGGHDARGDGLLEPEGAAQRHNPLADGQVVGVAKLHNRKTAGVLGLQHGHVGGGIGAHEIGLVGLSGDHDLVGAAAFHHMVVGDDVAILGQHDARSLGIGHQIARPVALATVLVAEVLAHRVILGSLGVHRDGGHRGQALRGHGLGQRRILAGRDDRRLAGGGVGDDR